MRVLIIGAGGHGQVLADILIRMQKQDCQLQPVGYLDDNPELLGQHFLGLPVLGSIDQLPRVSHEAVIIGIGNNQRRAHFFDLMRTQNENIMNAIHPSAVIASDVRLGKGVAICAGVVVNTVAILGDNTILNTSCSVDHHNHISSHAHIAPGVHLGGNVSIGTGAFVGIASAIIPGCRVGDWAVVGAGSSVVRDIPPFTTAVGVPAKVIKRHLDLQ